jgi:serine/threonine-protein kinase
MRIGDTLLDRYTLTEVLGEGGMGVVYRAVDQDGTEVAIKRLHSDIATTPELIARFEREAAAHALLSHPHIAALWAVGACKTGELCFVMELVDGPTLADVIERGPMQAREAIAIAKQILSALHHAHQLGMVHRDLKPENVLLTTDHREQWVVKLIDFGLVKLVQNVLGSTECKRLTTRGIVFGTPRYMPPEQILGSEIDGRTDLYALGIMLYEMLTGRVPFDSDEVAKLWRMHLSAPIPSLGEHGSPDLDAVVSTLLAKAPDERFASALAVRRALEAALE